MKEKVLSLDSYKDLSELDMATVLGGKRHWYTPIVDFGQGFLDAF